MADITEANDSISPNSGGFSPEGGRALWTFQVTGEEADEVCDLILGSVEPSGEYRLHRVLPRVHPQWPWLMAHSISNIRGVGLKDDQGNAALLIESGAQADVPAAISHYLQYAQVDIEVEFVTVPYSFTFTDEEIGVYVGTWYDDLGQEQNFAYAEEWYRFTDWPKTPAPEFLEIRQGQMEFACAESSANNPHELAFPGLVRVPMPKEVLKVMWYRVPEYYATHPASYLSRFLWRVNQNQWMGYEPGELLYEGFGFPRRNVPPFPAEDEFFEGIFSTDKIVDIELTFRVCRFKTDEPPADVINPNWIANGHNLFPWHGNRKFYYVQTLSSTPSERVPTYRSAPFELLFTDPDILQPIGTLLQ